MKKKLEENFIKELNYNAKIDYISNYSNVRINVIEGNIIRSYGNNKNNIYIHKLS